ncbi:MAG: glycoside hydrolase family 3 C-terminal domain-containing protein, partial [Clostridia bacterium]
QGSQVDLRPVEDKLKAITWCCYNGEQQGTTAMNILFGKVNPSGRLPFTWYYDEAELPNIIDYAVRTNDKVAQKTQVTKTEYLGRTYQYFKGKVRYPFGYGLSYTDFEYSDLHIDRKTVSPDDTIKISFNVTNIGDVDGYEVAQVYVKSPNAGTADRPFKQLRGFDKKMIKSGETVRFEIDLPVYKMYFFDNEQHMIFDQGEYIIEVGHDSEKASQNTAKFMLNGELTRRIAHVVASPSAHFIRDVDTVISTNLSVAFNDESFADLEKDVKITFASANENIAVVDEKGNVTGKASGTTKIIATAEYKSAKSKTSFPVTVNFE